MGSGDVFSFLQNYGGTCEMDNEIPEKTKRRTFMVS